MIVTDNDELNDILRCLRAHGWTRDLSLSNQLCSKQSVDAFEESLGSYYLVMFAAIGVISCYWDGATKEASKSYCWQKKEWPAFTGKNVGSSSFYYSERDWSK